MKVDCQKLHKVEFEVRQTGDQAAIIFSALLYVFSNKERFIKEMKSPFCEQCWDEFHKLLDQFAENVEHARLHGVD